MAGRGHHNERQAIRFGRRDLRAALRRLSPEDLTEVFKFRYLPIAWQPGREFWVAADGLGEGRARALGRPVIGRVPPGEITAALEAVFGRALVEEPSWDLAQSMPRFSAFHRLTPAQAGVLGLVGLALAAACYLAPGMACLTLAFIAAVFFLAVIGLRLFAIFPPSGRADWPPESLTRAELPVYTVLVPLYRETNGLRRLIASLEAIRYPREKLDIKLILEESDTYMRRAVARLALKPPFEVLTVPFHGPRTKPKALNYGLAFARGDLVTIFDAEDIPEPRQLLYAARLFAAAPPEVVCLQAHLTFYNPGENWLTRGIMAQTPQLFGCRELV